MKCKLFYIFSLLLFLALGRHRVQCNNEEDTWIDPKAWHGLGLDTLELENDSVCSKCEAFRGGDGAVKDDVVALLYYKKFIANLFNRKKLQYDNTLALYQRNVLFTLHPSQLEQLENLADPRDLDTILTEIFSNARTQSSCDRDVPGSGGHWSSLALVWDILKDCMLLLKTSEVQFLLLFAGAILLGWFLHRRYHIGILTLIVGGVIFFGYFVTYLECNKKLEVDLLLEIIEKDQKQRAQDEPRWFTPITNWIGGSDSGKETLNKQSIKMSKVNLAYCRPDHVLILYANELFFKQLEFLLEKCTETLIKLKGSFSFPFNYLAGTLMIVLIAYIVKLTFEHILSPRAWANLLNRSSSHQQPQPHHFTAHPAPIGDHISGENLKLLLNAISSPSIIIRKDAIEMNGAHTVSGIQSVLDQLEAESTTGSTSSSASNSPNSVVAAADKKEVSDSNVSEQDLGDTSKAKLEDDKGSLET